MPVHKVLHLIDSGGLYGAERMLLGLVQQQTKIGMQPMILSGGALGQSQKPIEKEAERLGIPVTPWRSSMTSQFSAFRSLIRSVSRSGFEVLHSHGYKFNILSATLRRSAMPIATVATLHGYVAQNRLSKIRVYETLDRLLLKRLDMVVTVNRQLGEVIGRYVESPDRIQHIPNCIGTDDSTANLHSSTHKSIREFTERHRFNVCFVGRLSPEKCVEHLLEAFKTVVARNPGAGLCIAGDGRLADPLRARASELGLADEVLFCGYVEHMHSLLPHFDCIVLPSKTEGLPIVLLEAMQAGVPIVASEVGGIPELLDGGKAGLLFPPGDVDRLADSIASLVDDQQTASRLAENARLRFDRHYSSESMADAYNRVYERARQLAEGHNSGP